MKRSGPQCQSCNRLGGVERALDGHVVVMCDECWPSDFRRGRVTERVQEHHLCPCAACQAPENGGGRQLAIPSTVES